MSAARKGHVVKRSLALVAAAILGFVFLSEAERSQTPNSAAPVKLAGPLADLAQSVPQERGPVSKIREAPRGFSMESMPKSARDAVTTRMMRINSYGEVQVYVLVTEINDVNLKQLQSAGVTIQLQDDKRRMVQALVPVSRLAQVSELPFVRFVRLPTYARRRTGSVDTEGDAILHAIDARQQLGIDGTGVRVAAISDGLKGVFATGCTTCSGVADGPISKGDLPNATGTRNSAGVLISSSGGITGTPFPAGGDLEGLPPPGCGFAGAGAEGTALLEIIHDIAPGAQLSFANFGDTDLDFNNAVNAMAAANDVVVDDIGFFGEPFDGTSDISTNTANALNSTTNPIRAYVTSVGNEADGHYLGAYTDSSTDGFSVTKTHGDLHLFQATASTADTLSQGPQTFNEIELQQNGEVVVFLSWDDPFGSSTNDFGVYLVQHGTSTVVASDAGKTCEGPAYPTSCLSYVNTGAQGFFDILIQNPGNASAAKNLNLFAFTPECALASLVSLGPSRAKLNFNTTQSSVIAESDAGGSPISVISVGAICSASAKAQQALAGSLFPDLSCEDTTNSTIEYFSSVGPTLDGRTKPDITGIDGVSITGAGNFENPFFGTSAAAPHVAGIAALTLEAAPCLLSSSSGAVNNVTARTNLRNLLLNNADPVGGASPQDPNDTFGSGRINALTSADATLPVFSGPPAISIGGNATTGANITASQLGFSDPNTCLLTTMKWSGGCGSGGPASTMSCAFGAPTTVTVQASNNGVSYSSPAAIQVTVTDFTLTESPSSATVTAGQSASYQVTIGVPNGSFNGSIMLTCGNLPTATTCAFSPAAQVSPGSLSAQATLTITTTARSLAPPSHDPPSNRLLRWTPFGGQHHSLPPAAYWLVTAAIVLGWLALRWPRLARIPRFATLGIALLTLALVPTLAACGGGSSSPPTESGTPAGTYSITVSGTSGTLVHSATATLVVN